jgi:hypothetical protein
MLKFSLLEHSTDHTSRENNPTYLERLLKPTQLVSGRSRRSFTNDIPKSDLDDFQFRRSSCETLGKAIKSTESVLHAVLEFQHPNSGRQVEKIVSKVVLWRIVEVSIPQGEHEAHLVDAELLEGGEHRWRAHRVDPVRTGKLQFQDCDALQGVLAIK